MLTIILSVLNFVYELVLAIYRDYLGAKLLIQSKKRVAVFEKQNLTVFEHFQKLVRQQPNKACIVCEGQTWTYKDVTKKFHNKNRMED